MSRRVFEALALMEFISSKIRNKNGSLGLEIISDHRHHRLSTPPFFVSLKRLERHLQKSIFDFFLNFAMDANLMKRKKGNNIIPIVKK